MGDGARHACRGRAHGHVQRTVAQRSFCLPAPCSGRGTPTQSSARWRGSSGSPCCQRSGTHRRRGRSIAGALTRASSRAPQLRRRLIRGAATPHACRSRPNENTHACYVTLLYILLAPVRRKCMCATPHVPAVMSMRLLRSFIAYLKIPIPAVNSQKEPSRAPKRLISELLI